MYEKISTYYFFEILFFILRNEIPIVKNIYLYNKDIAFYIQNNIQNP